VTGAVQAAAIRRRIRIPLRFADGYSTTATVVSFTGLSRSTDRAAGPQRHADPAHLGIADR
jgi:GTP cyclohydrolase II